MANTNSERRLAANREPQPTGSGDIVLEDIVALLDQSMVIGKILEQGEDYTPIMPTENLQALKEDLVQRAEFGKAKYGTYLRTQNGRRAIVDLYQEVLDGIMYCTQAKAEGDTDAGLWLEILINIGQSLAGTLNRRAAAQ